MKRKSYSPEFKAKIALEAIKGVMTANEIGAKYEATALIELYSSGDNTVFPDVFKYLMLKT